MFCQFLKLTVDIFEESIFEDIIIIVDNTMDRENVKKQNYFICKQMKPQLRLQKCTQNPIHHRALALN